MVEISIRYFFNIISVIYAFNKIANRKISTTLNVFVYIIFASFISFVLLPLCEIESTIRLLFSLISFLLFISIYTRTNLKLSLAISIISFALSFVSLVLVTFPISIICIVIFPNMSLINICPIILIGILQLILLSAIFKIKRLKNGMPFLLKNALLLTDLLPASLIIAIFFITQKYLPSSRSTRLLFAFTISFLAIALLIWWRHKITQSYVEKLRVDEVELLYKEISDKDLEIEKLHAHNEQLSGIIHKDNKLIPAMEMAVRNYLQTAALMKPEDARQTGAELLSKLERMAEERTGIIHTYQENFSYRQRSGLISIDAIVDYMENRASTLGIEYHYQFDKTLKEMLPAFITEDDAMHLLSDLIENAIIAATHSEKKNIHIHIGFIRSILFIDISDSGIPFTPETYEKFGNIQYTTHAEHGGSGIGLMDIAKLKRQYQFSLQIYEYPENESIYTKKIRILFDRKSHYLIQSYRAKELRSAILRNDLHVIPYSDKEKP